MALPPFFLISTTLIAEEPISTPTALFSPPAANLEKSEKKFLKGLFMYVIIIPYNAILIPIPLSSKRYRERGYNQAELLCENLVKLDENVNFKLEKNILIKQIDTKHQAHILNRSERLKNIVGSFTILYTGKNIGLIKNKNIILIDDITTTGATLTEARKVFKQAGARKIIAFTVAH